jgi:mannose-6-phosphate isomerase-like protein (cupin superfamily)
VSHPDPSAPPDLRPIELGEALENPVTRERAVIIELPWQNADGRAVAEMTALPGARVVGEHLHPAIHERFSVLKGELTVIRNGQRSTLREGESAEIEPGVWHDWFNRGTVDAVVRVEITPGERFAHMIETLFGLARGARQRKGDARPAPTRADRAGVLRRHRVPQATAGGAAHRVRRAGSNRPAAWLPPDLPEPLAHNPGAEGAEDAGRLTGATRHHRRGPGHGHMVEIRPAA